MRKGITKDLSSVTHIPHYTLETLFSKIPALVAHNIYEATIEEEDEISIDIGFGNLLVSIAEDEVRMRFSPNRKLEQMIKDIMETKTDPLIASLEENLREKIESAYKNLC